MDNKIIYEIFGYIGGGILTIALLPQFYKTLTQKSTKDLSLLWISTHLTGIFCILIYSAGLLKLGVDSILPILISISLELIIASCMFIVIVLTKMKIIKWHQEEIELP